MGFPQPTSGQTPGGAAGGDLGGTYPNPTAVNLHLSGDTAIGHKLTNVTDPTAAGDASTKNYVDNVAAGINPAVAVRAATTQASDTSGLTYANGVAGVGASLTGSIATAITFDGQTLTAVNQRVLVKNDTQSPSGAFNGVYYLSQLQTGILPPILIRALDYDTPTDITNTGVVPVQLGTLNGGSSWLLTTAVATVGTDPLTYVQFTYPLSNQAANVLTTTGDLLYASAANTLARRGIGSGNQVVGVSGGLPAWVTQLITSVFGRTGAVVATTGDYTAAQVTNAMSTATYDAAAIAQQVLGTTATQTATNKRITKRTGTAASSATPTINTDNVDFYSLTAQAADITSMTTNLSGTPTEAQTLWIAITGTAARAITWGSSFEASTVALPTTTVTTARLDVGFIWNTVTSKWRCVAVA